MPAITIKKTKSKHRVPVVVIVEPDPPRPQVPRVMYEGLSSLDTFSELGMGPTAERK